MMHIYLLLSLTVGLAAANDHPSIGSDHDHNQTDAHALKLRPSCAYKHDDAHALSSSCLEMWHRNTECDAHPVHCRASHPSLYKQVMALKKKKKGGKHVKGPHWPKVSGRPAPTSSVSSAAQPSASSMPPFPSKRSVAESQLPGSILYDRELANPENEALDADSTESTDLPTDPIQRDQDGTTHERRTESALLTPLPKRDLIFPCLSKTPVTLNCKKWVQLATFCTNSPLQCANKYPKFWIHFRRSNFGKPGIELLKEGTKVSAGGEGGGVKPVVHKKKLPAHAAPKFLGHPN